MNLAEVYNRAGAVRAVDVIMELYQVEGTQMTAETAKTKLQQWKKSTRFPKSNPLVKMPYTIVTPGVGGQHHSRTYLDVDHITNIGHVEALLLYCTDPGYCL